jgi:hypothetical protein
LMGREGLLNRCSINQPDSSQVCLMQSAEQGQR